MCTAEFGRNGFRNDAGAGLSNAAEELRFLLPSSATHPWYVVPSEIGTGGLWKNPGDLIEPFLIGLSAIKCMATMRKNRSTPSKKAKQAKPKVPRRAIDEALLMVRLGLNEDWIEVWEDGDGWRAESLAPSELPAFIREKIEREARDDSKTATVTEWEGIKRTAKETLDAVNLAIERLTQAGCCKEVIYFCLDQLSPEEEEWRSKGELMTRSRKQRVQSASADDESYEDQNFPAYMTRRKLATREDMERLVRAARSMRGTIFRYSRELSIVADAIDMVKAEYPANTAADSARGKGTKNTEANEVVVELPSGLETTPVDADDALLLLTNSLLWVLSLAKAYTAPMQSTLLKSKGLLFLTAYVELVIRECKPHERVRAKMRGYVADLANAAVGTPEKQLSPSYLLDKLENFKRDHPRLHERLELNVDKLHEFHTNRYLRKRLFHSSHPQIFHS